MASSLPLAALVLLAPGGARAAEAAEEPEPAAPSPLTSGALLEGPIARAVADQSMATPSASALKASLEQPGPARRQQH